MNRCFHLLVYPSPIIRTTIYPFTINNIEDVSQLSLGGNAEQDDKGDLIGSPPPSPLFTSEGPSGGAGGIGGQTKGKQTIHPTKTGQPLFKKYQDSSLDADETESELVAIPESDLSDSTMHGSSAPVCQ